jgi:hypothetical protein
MKVKTQGAATKVGGGLLNLKRGEEITIITFGKKHHLAFVSREGKKVYLKIKRERVI